MGRRHGARRCGDDRGIALVLVSLMLVTLLVMAAFAVDLGRIYAERRQDQSAVDAGALSGGWQILFGTSATDSVVFDEVTRITYEGLDPATRPASLAAWRALWPACTDPDAAGRGYTVRLQVGSTRYDCIRKTANGRAIRVKLPQRSVDTMFAGVIGYNQLTTTAFAEAGLTPLSTNILPFAVTSGDLTSSLACLVAAPDGLGQPDCSGPNSGNFGYVASPRPTSTTNQACNGGFGRIISENIASSLDHYLAVDPDPVTGDAAEVSDVCVGTAVPDGPNRLYTETGRTADVADFGLFGQSNDPFEDGGFGRLTRGSCTTTKQVRLGDQLIDWCPLWTYFDTFSAGDVGATDLANQIPAACWTGVAFLLQDGNASTNPTKATMKACLDAYDAGGYTTDLFTPDLAESARYAWVPESWEDIADLNGQSGYFTVKRFRVVFLQTIWMKEGNTSYEFNPGQSASSALRSNAQFVQLSAFLLNPETIPQSVLDDGPTRGLPSLSLIR